MKPSDDDLFLLVKSISAVLFAAGHDSRCVSDPTLSETDPGLCRVCRAYRLANRLESLVDRKEAARIPQPITYRARVSIEPRGGCAPLRDVRAAVTSICEGAEYTWQIPTPVVPAEEETPLEVVYEGLSYPQAGAVASRIVRAVGGVHGWHVACWEVEAVLDRRRE